MTPLPEPRTAAGRDLLMHCVDGDPGSDDWWSAKIQKAEAEAAGAPLPPLDAHDTHTPCCAIPAEHKWADPIRCLKDHENWPCRAALTATPAEPFYDSDGIPIPDELFAGLEHAPAPLDVDALALYLHQARTSNDEPVYDMTEARRRATIIAARLTARAAAAEDHEGFSPTQPGNTHWKRTPLARAVTTEPTCGHDSIAADCPICAVYARAAAMEDPNISLNRAAATEDTE